MNPGNVLVLPKPDKRYRPGKISKDKKGAYRGHPSTVTVRPMEMPDNTLGLEFDINPPLLASPELAEWLRKQGENL